MNEKLTGKLSSIAQAETLLLGNQEVGRIEFAILTEDGKTAELYAISGEGTAFHTLEYDARFQVGTPVVCYVQRDSTRAPKATGVRLLDTADASGAQETDIARLKDKAMRNINMRQGELHALLSAFAPDTPQHYAIAVQLRRQHRDRTVAIAEKVCRCQMCRATFELGSPRYAFAWGKSRCPQCDENVVFDLVDPLPSEPRASEEELTFEEVQRRLDEKFGRRK